MTLAVGVDIGGTKIAAGVVDAHGEVHAHRSVATPSSGTAILDAVAAMCAELIDTVGADAVPVGVGTAGVVDADGVISSATDLLGDWLGTPVRRRLETRLRTPVSIVNDVHAHALGEGWRGAAAGCSDFLVVAVGTGIGGAIVTGSRLYAGAHSAAGHLGHVPSREAAGLPCSCGATGHLEAVASGSAIQMQTAAVGHTEALRISARALGSALGGLVNVLDPELVVVTGGVSNAGDEWWQLLRAALEPELLPATRGVQVVPGLLGPDAGVVGAARLAMTKEVA